MRPSYRAARVMAAPAAALRSLSREVRDRGTVSVLRASCDSTEGRKSIEEGRGS